jgi:hypothetical protein
VSTTSRGLAGLAGILGLACGPVNIGTLPQAAEPALAVVAIEDGATAEPRPLSLGQEVGVRVVLRNEGGAAATGVATRLLLRAESGSAVSEADVQPESAPPSSIGAGDTVRVGFRVRILPGAPRGIWFVTARVDADRGGVPAAATEPLRRTWLVQRPPSLRVTRFSTAVGNTSLGYTSLNPGCPVVLSAEIENAGEAAALVRDATLGFEGPMPTLVSLSSGVQAGTRIEGRSAVTASFRVESPERILGGSRYTAALRIRAADANSDQPAVVEIAAESPELVVSGARLAIQAITPERSFVRAGQTGVPVSARVAYFPGERSAPRLDRVSVSVKLGRPAWPVHAAPENPSTLPACPPPPGLCDGLEWRFTVDVPPGEEPGIVPIGFDVAGLDQTGELNGPSTPVVVCGGREREGAASLEVVR